MKRLYVDIETSPILADVWGRYEQNVVHVERESHLLSFAYMWSDEKKVRVLALPDFKRYKHHRHDDQHLVRKLWELIDKSDVTVAHNGDNFDIKVILTTFIHLGLPPPSPFKTVDTCKIARKVFRFSSNKLDDLGEYLGLGRKIKTGGYDLWDRCLHGDMKAWGLMKKYNAQDVVLLEKVYQKLLPWIPNHPNYGYWKEGPVCRNCGSKHTIKRGSRLASTGTMRQAYQCKDCGHYSSGEITAKAVLR